MVSYKLTYFDGRGAGELCRQIFAAAEQKYEDNRLTDEEWEKFKAAGKTPYNQLPMLEVDGKPLAQSHAMARYLAREFGFNGKSRWEEAQVNSLADQYKDYYAEARPYLAVKLGYTEGDAEALYTSVYLPVFKKHYGFFVNALKASGSGFLVGNSLTFIDLLVAQHSADLLGREKSDLFNDVPEMKAHSEKVQSIPQIKKWIETRPASDW
ncbi:glutathione transferase [Caenorhabditis elegans]|uniref:glutathione transferase n=1 Tax=Caenorhabditis elegans TaxID=6239 RepID=O45451_CAEEL|nr:Glutathione transferase [Caenorhabditis elegans]CAB04293.1 Glutathione transferase [Caenorhabditis elegans]|eukprot:NP_506983.1 Glutathione S-Transferase [Caenorhabditis elegans]